jgi:hypothetical protein
MGQECRLTYGTEVQTDIWDRSTSVLQSHVSLYSSPICQSVLQSHMSVCTPVPYVSLYSCPMCQFVLQSTDWHMGLEYKLTHGTGVQTDIWDRSTDWHMGLEYRLTNGTEIYRLTYGIGVQTNEWYCRIDGVYIEQLIIKSLLKISPNERFDIKEIIIGYNWSPSSPVTASVLMLCILRGVRYD